MPTPRAASSSQSGMTSRSPWFTDARSGSSVHAATRASRRAGSGSIAAEVLRETGTPGHAARTARSAAAHGAAASVWRPASSYGCRWSDRAPAATAARASAASSGWRPGVAAGGRGRRSGPPAGGARAGSGGPVPAAGRQGVGARARLAHGRRAAVVRARATTRWRPLPASSKRKDQSARVQPATRRVARTAPSVGPLQRAARLVQRRGPDRPDQCLRVAHAARKGSSATRASTGPPPVARLDGHRGAVLGLAAQDRQADRAEVGRGGGAGHPPDLAPVEQHAAAGRRRAGRPGGGRAGGGSTRPRYLTRATVSWPR